MERLTLIFVFRMESPNATCDKKEGIRIWHHDNQERIWITMLGTNPGVGVALLQYLEDKRESGILRGDET